MRSITTGKQLRTTIEVGEGLRMEHEDVEEIVQTGREKGAV